MKNLQISAVRTAIAVTGLYFLSLFTGCVQQKKEETKSIDQIQLEQGIPVQVREMAPGTLRAVALKSGTVEGIFQTTISNAMPGTIRAITVRVGDKAEKGRTLVKMQPDGGSPYTAAKSAHDLAENAYKRAESLHKEGAVSQDMVEGARTQFENCRRQLNMAIEAENVVAPFSGTVLEVYETLNKKIGSGTRLVKLARVDQIRIDLDINESIIKDFEKGQRAFIVMDADTVWGEVTDVAIGASEQSHTFPVKTLFNNNDMKIKPGMFVTVYVIVREQHDILALSAESIIMERGESYVYVVQGDTAVKRTITLGMRGGAEYAITGGLEQGDRVVVSGASLLNDGSKVKIVQ